MTTNIGLYEMRHYWNYYCSICDRLEKTEQYVDHGFYDGIMKNGLVNSFEFQQIIILSAAEFENVAKLIDAAIDQPITNKFANIKNICTPIILKFPEIQKTKLSTIYSDFYPLKDFAIDANGNILGIPWWYVYDDLKHNSYMNYKKATLENAIQAVSSLMVFELYLMYLTQSSIDISGENRCHYFDNEYTYSNFVTRNYPLPDFNNEKK